jgi:hypothetical protein
MNRARQIILIPVAELAPGAVSAIRNEIINILLARATRELSKPRDQLVVRDIRPFDDLHWATHEDIGTTALTENQWVFTSDDSANYGKFTPMIATDYATMAEERFVAIYGVKDMRMSLATPVAQALSMLMINVGGNDKVIWDLQNMQAYPEALAAVCPPPGVIIPPSTTYQIYGYGGLSDDGASTDINCYIVLEGIVVEPKGKVISP